MATTNDNPAGVSRRAPQQSISSIGQHAAGAWYTSESRALELLALEKIMPHLGTIREIRWGEVTKQVFDEHPGVKDSDKLRLIFKEAMSIGKKDMVIKTSVLLAKIKKYGENINSINEFWKWVEKKYGKSREKQQERLSNFTKEQVIGGNIHPVDALEEALWEHGFEWDDIECDAKVQNIMLSALRRDVNYIKIEELMERNAVNWKTYLDQEWSKHAAPAYRRQMGYTRCWERATPFKNGSKGGRRPPNIDY